MDIARGNILVDIVDSETRSRIMARIGSRDTKPELALRRALHALGFRYRLCDPKLPGKPDLVLARYNAVIFVHGCFWHRHPGCKLATIPATRTEFWAAKFEANIVRDRRCLSALEGKGWKVRVVWECQLKKDTLAKTIDDVSAWLKGGVK